MRVRVVCSGMDVMGLFPHASPGFERGELVLAPGAERVFVVAEWVGALVVVTAGVLELVCAAGVRRRFGAGAMLWLAGLPVESVRNPGDEPVVLLVLARRGVA